MKYRTLAITFLFVIGIAGCSYICMIPGVSSLGLCSPTATPSDTPTPTMVATETATDTPTATLTPTPTSIETPV
jgi:hypothetical protein